MMATCHVTCSGPYVWRKVVQREIHRSWLGDGIQQDDINCHSVEQVEHIEYDKLKLQLFIAEVLNGYSVEPAKS